jgi:hypothetical protein
MTSNPYNLSKLLSIAIEVQRPRKYCNPLPKLIQFVVHGMRSCYQGYFFWLQNTEGEPVVGGWLQIHQLQVLPPYFAARKNNPGCYPHSYTSFTFCTVAILNGLENYFSNIKASAHPIKQCK